MSYIYKYQSRKIGIIKIYKVTGDLISSLDGDLLMDLDKTVFNNGEDLYIYLNQRINDKTEDKSSIIGEVVKIMEVQEEPQILIIPGKYSKMLLDYLEEQNQFEKTFSANGALLILRNLFGLELIFSSLTDSIQIF